MTVIASNEPPRLINAREVVKRTTLSRSTILRMVRDQAFPAPIRFGVNHIAWREKEVSAWIETRA